jgi:hypothetical protein
MLAKPGVVLMLWNKHGLELDREEALLGLVQFYGTSECIIVGRSLAIHQVRLMAHISLIRRQD